MRLLLVIVIVLNALRAPSQQEYEITPDTKHPESKIIKGRIDKKILQKDSSFSGYYYSSQKNYSPDSTVLDVFRKYGSDVYYVVFGGTWCDDTQMILPQFFKLQEMTQVPEDHLILYGVDRNKKTLGNIAEALAITNVPTIIVMKNGKELGRVVESGKTGHWDIELAEIISSH